ncbi:hypothetical protein KAT80_03130 [Candidatus Pacearchaeota archaeon]|nr:hypothetical protein [Candidatus Pacearchaeota archaeon]
MINKKAQEEIMGFALIIVLVAIIGLIFLGFSLRNPQKEIVESYEVESFIQAFLQYTTDCGNYRENYLPIQKIISKCVDDETCLDGRDSCDVLSSTLTEIIEESWKVDGDRPIQGYKLEIVLEDGTEVIPLISNGNSTKNSKGVLQPFMPLGENYEIYFTVYY